MKTSAHKALKLGYGLGILSFEGAKKVAEVVKSELKLNEVESRKLALELIRNSEKASKDVISAASKHLEVAVLKSGLVSKTELRRAKSKVKSRINSKLGIKKDSVWQRVKKKVLRKKK